MEHLVAALVWTRRCGVLGPVDLDGPAVAVTVADRPWPCPDDRHVLVPAANIPASIRSAIVMPCEPAGARLAQRRRGQPPDGDGQVVGLGHRLDDSLRSAGFLLKR